MSHHPNEALVKIVGIEEGGCGCSCEDHNVCGKALIIDSVVRFCSIQILNDTGVEETAIGVNWVTDGIDRCLVGFLPCHCIPFKQKYEGRVAQIVNFLKTCESPSARQQSHQKQGVCMAALLQISDKK